MARLNDTILTSGGPLYTPNCTTEDYCLLTKSKICDFLILVDICSELRSNNEPSAEKDWVLINNALKSLTDARFTQIGKHSRLALAISCIEGLLCNSSEEIKKEDLAKKCSLILSTVKQTKSVVNKNIIQAYNVRSKFVHGHRSVSQKLASEHKLLDSIEGYARRLIIMACHLSHNLRFGKILNVYQKFQLPAVFKAATNSNHELGKILRMCNYSNGKNLRPLLR